MDTSLKQKRGLQTTVGFKVVMAFSGIVLVIFVLFHMYGNLKMFFGAESYNHYAEWLKHDLLYPILPHGWFIWIFRICLLLFLLGHAGAAACGLDLVFPARAGMSRLRRRCSPTPCGFPRTRGDEPTTLRRLSRQILFSPHARG